MFRIRVKQIVLTGKPKNLVLLENGELPYTTVKPSRCVTSVSSDYAKENFGFFEPWCYSELAGLLQDDGFLTLYYVLVIAEETSVKRGKWEDVMSFLQRTNTEEADIIKKAILKWNN